MSEIDDCIIVSHGHSATKVWHLCDSRLAYCTAPVDGTSADHRSDRLSSGDDIQATVHALRTAMASLFVSSSTRIIVLTNGDDSSRALTCVSEWLTRTTCVSPAKLTQLPQALFMAQLHAVHTAVVIDIGHHATRVSPICEGIVVASCVNFTTGMGIFRGMEHTCIEELLHHFTILRGDADCTESICASSKIVSEHPLLLDLVCLVDGLEEAIRRTANEVKRLGVAACLSHFVLSGGGMDCESLRSIVYNFIHTVAPHAVVSWE